MRIKAITYRIGIVRYWIYYYTIKRPIWLIWRAIKRLISRYINPCYPVMKRLKYRIEELEKKIERELEFRDDRIRIKMTTIARLEREIQRCKRLLKKSERKGKF